MAAFQKFNGFVNDVIDKVHNLASDTLNVMLTNTAPVATNDQYSQLVDLATGNGYTAGGAQTTQSSSGQTGGDYKLVLNNVVFTASGNSIGPFRYAVLYNNTAANKNLIGWWDYGSSITLAIDETFTVQFDATNGVLQLQ